ncbi:hypothetical protein TeGR_g8309, partial [Tetraparma gracilis]
TAVLATSPSGVLSVLRAASKNRAVAATCCNARSSRSHAVLRFSVLRRTPGKGGDAGSEKVRRGALTFVDLAGSERLSAVGNPNRPAAAATAREARQINKSISALGNVILALSAGPAGGPPATLAHVPFRDSKLTRLLTGTLGGRAACVLVANVSASPGHAEEAAMTLSFAERCMRVAAVPERCESVVRGVPAREKKAAAKRAPDDNAKLAEKYKARKSEWLQRQGRQRRGEREPEQPRAEAELGRIEELEREVDTLKRLLANKREEPPDQVDLLGLDYVNGGPDGTAVDFFATARNDLTRVVVEDDPMRTSQYNRANQLNADAEQLKKDLLVIAAGGAPPAATPPLMDREELGELGESTPEADGDRSRDSVDEFFSRTARKEGWQHERRAMQDTIERLQTELAKKNVRVATLERQLELERGGGRDAKENGGGKRLTIAGGGGNKKVLVGAAKGRGAERRPLGTVNF